MFKIGDKIKLKNNVSDLIECDYYVVTEIGPTNMEINCTKKGYEGYRYYVDINTKKWKLDEIYLRKLKLEKICSKMAIE